jgi:hypothetical protein
MNITSLTIRQIEILRYWQSFDQKYPKANGRLVVWATSDDENAWIDATDVYTLVDAGFARMVADNHSGTGNDQFYITEAGRNWRETPTDTHNIRVTNPLYEGWLGERVEAAGDGFSVVRISKDGTGLPMRRVLKDTDFEFIHPQMEEPKAEDIIIPDGTIVKVIGLNATGTVAHSYLPASGIRVYRIILPTGTTTASRSRLIVVPPTEPETVVPDPTANTEEPVIKLTRPQQEALDLIRIGTQDGNFAYLNRGAMPQGDIGILRPIRRTVARRLVQMGLAEYVNALPSDNPDMRITDKGRTLLESLPPVIRRGKVGMMSRAQNEKGYHIEQVDGWILGQWGVGKNPYDGYYYCVFLPNGEAPVVNSINRKSAMELMKVLHKTLGSDPVDTTDRDSEVAQRLRNAVAEWRNK